MALPEEELKRSGCPEERRQTLMSDFPPPAGQELILRATVPQSAPYSKALPQRMYSMLTKEDFRLAGAFSSDSSFFLEEDERQLLPWAPEMTLSNQ